MRLTYLLYPGIEPIDLAPLGVFSMGRRIVPELEFELVSVDRSPVELSNGLIVVPNRTFDEIERVDVLLVPGGGGWRQAAQNEAILSFIRYWAAQNATLVSICTGSLILAAAGVLDGLHATTKSRVVPPESPPIDDLSQSAHVTIESNALLVDNGQVITGGGVSLCLDATFYLLANRYGEEAATQIAHIMEYDAARAANLTRLPIVRPTVPTP